MLGEARGAEVRELLAALNTGHEGGCGTVHANSAADVLTRFEALGALAGMSPAAVHAQLVSAVAVVVHLARSSVDGETRRRVETVGVLVRDPAGRPSVVAALSSGRTDQGPGGEGSATTRGPGWPRLLEVLGSSELEEPVRLLTGGSGPAGLSWSSAARSEGPNA